MVSKHGSRETWTLEETSIFSTLITLGKIIKPWTFAHLSLGIWSIIMMFSSEFTGINSGAGERRPQHRRGWETWGQVGLLSGKHPGGLTAKLCFSCCAEIPSLRGKCLQKCGPMGTLHKSPSSQPCHHEFGLAEKTQTPTSFKTSYAHGAPGSHRHHSATRHSATWSSKLPISLPDLVSPESQSCTHSDFSIIVNLQIIQPHLIKTERRN